MAYGGKITVTVDGGRWQINGEATKLRLEPSLWAVLVDPTAEPEITPAVVHFPLAAEEITRRQYRLTAELGQTAIKLSF
jgi:histidine phosphotransferase ChpT